MIRVTRLNGQEVIINSEIIEFVEDTPHTVITMRSGNKIITRETADEIIDKVVEYRQRIFNDASMLKRKRG